MNIDTADTAWVLVCAALVLLMTPGLALFYGGMVHSKNVLSTFMHSFVAMGILTIQWVAFGYSLAFGPSHGGIIGGLDLAFLNGVGLGAVSETVKIPQLLFMAFQMMFAIITPALISGAFAERIKFSTYIVFSLLWATLVYDPVCHWVWNGDGWLLKRGALDFAGGTVVHMTAGFSALVFAIVIGKRKRPAPPHNLTMTLLGAGILWFGWFGFNAGSALASGGLATLALVNTHIAAAVGAVAWAIVEYLKQGKATALGIASGLVAGLVGITPAAGFVSPVSAAVIGAAAGVVCFGGVMLKSKLGYDDALDAFGVHGVGGLLGALLTGVLASSGWNSAVTAQGAELVMEQAIGAGVTAVYSVAVTFVLLKVLDATMGLRVEEDVEREGLDVNLHGEQGYILGGEGGMLAGDEGPAHGHAVAHAAPVVSTT
jgi:ammonium transporter, Amt family